MVDHSIKRITTQLLEEIKQALKSVDGYGSVELIIQDSRVVQISVRSIKKTNHNMKSNINA